MIYLVVTCQSNVPENLKLDQNLIHSVPIWTECIEDVGSGDLGVGVLGCVCGMCG